MSPISAALDGFCVEVKPRASRRYGVGGESIEADVVYVLLDVVPMYVADTDIELQAMIEQLVSNPDFETADHVFVGQALSGVPLLPPLRNP